MWLPRGISSSCNANRGIRLRAERCAIVGFSFQRGGFLSRSADEKKNGGRREGQGGETMKSRMGRVECERDDFGESLGDISGVQLQHGGGSV